MTSLALDATVQHAAHAQTSLAPPDEAFSSAPTAVASPASNADACFPGTTSSGGRTTVFPRILGNGAGVKVVSETRSRYEPIKLLDAGAAVNVLPYTRG